MSTWALVSLSAALAGAAALAALGSGPAVPAAVLAIAAAGAAVWVALASTRELRREHERALTMLDELGVHDPMTGALTSDAFQRALGAWVGRGPQRRLESALALVHVDGLDQLEHPAADAVRRRVVRLMQDALRETDAVGRIGDDDFGIVLPATSAGAAAEVGERIRTAVTRHAGVQAPPITVSIGVTGSHDFLDPWSAANRALELARTSGGDAVVSAVAESALPVTTGPELAPSRAAAVDRDELPVA